jgi:hypothetical protein
VSPGPGTAVGLTAADIERVMESLSDRVSEIRPTRWGWKTPGAVVRTASGAEVVIQRRPAAESDRIGVATEAFCEAGVPVARLRLRISDGADELVAFDLVAGDVGAALLGHPDGPMMAREMGATLARIRATSSSRIPVDPAWMSPGSIAAAAIDWLDEGPAADRLVAGVTAATDHLAAIPWATVGSHGDYAPVNALFVGGRLGALLDLADAALRHPLVDPAWWSLVVGHHHPERAAERDAFLGASRVEAAERDLAAVALVRALQVDDREGARQRSAPAGLLAAALVAWERVAPESA